MGLSSQAKVFRQPAGPDLADHRPFGTVTQTDSVLGIMSPSDMKQAQKIEQETVTGQRVMRKLRWRILPFVLLLFVIALIDRNNISLAALTMNKELAITGQQFGLVFGIFFLGYFVFEIPSNLLLHRI